MLEGILSAIFDIFGQFIFQILLELFTEIGLRRLGRDSSSSRMLNPVIRFLGYSLLGAVMGAISIAILPHHLLHSGKEQIANLVLTPLAAGAVMAGLGRWRSRRNQPLIGLDHFWCGWGFAFALAGVRYLWCK